jgi:hypothetical protein
MTTRFGRWRNACAYIVIAAAPFGAAGAATPVDGNSVEAVWKAQRVNFEYRGYSTQYTCRSLEDKLETILITMGAHEGIQLNSYNCNEEMGVARFEIVLQSPVEATAENVRDITTYDSTDKLVARVNGTQLTAAEDVQRFPAEWKTVSFSRDRKMRLDRGDCELVQQLRQQILPRMSVQIVKDNIRCSSAFGNIGSPRLIVSALVPAKPLLNR